MKELKHCIRFERVLSEKGWIGEPQQINMLLEFLFHVDPEYDWVFKANFFKIHKQDVLNVYNTAQESIVWLEETLGNFHIDIDAEDVLQLFEKWISESSESDEYIYLFWD